MGEDWSGTYTLTIAAADDCRGALPQEARVRRYTAVVTQHFSSLEVMMTGATFATKHGRGDRFEGRVTPGGAVFNLSCDEGDDGCAYPGANPIVEQLATSTFLVVAESVVATGPDRSAGILDGYFDLSDRDPEGAIVSRIASCSSARHQFVLSR